MPGEQVGSAYAKLGLDDKEFSSGLDSAKGKFSSAVDSMESKAKGAGQAIGGAMKLGAEVAAVALAGVAVAGVKSYMDIESAAADAASKMDLGDIAKKSGVSMEEAFKGVKAHVMSLSDELGQLNTNAFDPTQIAQACANLAAGGFDVATASAKDLEPILSLATATTYDLGKSAGLAMSTMNQFGMGVEDIGRISDVYTTAAGKSAASMTDFDYAMQQAGPVANGVGMSFEELTARISKLADAGYGGEKSGTALRTAMLALTSPTKTQADTLDKLGLTYDQIDPRVHSFGETLDLLTSKGADIYDFGEIFGKEGAAIVYSSAQQSAALKDLTASLENSKGAASSMAKMMLDTLKGSLDTAMGAASSLAYMIGGMLAPTLKSALDWFSSSGAPAIREFIGAIAGGDWTKAGDMMTKGIKSAWDKLKDVGKQLYDKVKGVNWSGLGSYVTKGIKSAWDGLKNLGGQLLGWLQGVNWGSVGSSVAAGFTGLASWIYDAISGIDFSAIGTTIIGALGVVQDYMVGIGTSLYDAISTVDWSGIGQQVLASLSNIGSQIASIFSGINFGELGQGLLDSLTAIGSTITSVFQNIDFGGIADGIMGALSGIGNQVLGIFERVQWASVGKSLAEGIESGVKSLTGVAQSVADLFKKHSWDSVGSDIGEKIKGGLGKVAGWLDLVIKGAQSTMGDWGKIGTDAGNAIKEALGAIKDYAVGVYTNIKEGLKSWIMGNDLKTLGALAMDALVAGFAATAEILSAVGYAITKIFSVETLVNVVDWAAMGLLAIGQFITGFLAEGVNLGGELAARVLEGFSSALASSGIPGMDTLGGSIQGAADSIRAGSTSQANYMMYGPEALQSGFVAPVTPGQQALGTTNAKAAPQYSVDDQGNTYVDGKLTGNIFQADEDAGAALDAKEKLLRVETAKLEAAKTSAEAAASAAASQIQLTRANIQALWEAKAGGEIEWDWSQTAPTVPPRSSINWKNAGTEDATLFLGTKSGDTSTDAYKADPYQGAFSAFSGVDDMVVELAKNGYSLEEITAELSANLDPYDMPSGQDILKAFTEGTKIWESSGKAEALRTSTGVWKQTQLAADYVTRAFEEGKIDIKDGVLYWKDGTKVVVAETKKAAVDAGKTLLDATSDAMDDLQSTLEAAADAASGSFDGAAKAINGAAAAVVSAFSSASQNALTIGNSISSKFQNAGEAVRIGLTAGGQQIAVIGQVAQKQFEAAGGQWVGSTVSAATQAKAITTEGATAIQLAGNIVSSGLQSGATALQGAASAINGASSGLQSWTNTVYSGPSIGILGGAKSQTNTGSNLDWLFSDYGNNPWYAGGTETTGPELAVIGEDGKEFVIPTKKKRWDLLLAAMKAYGISGMAEGGSAGSESTGGTGSDEMKAYFGITGLASMSKSVQKIINDLKDFFRISWAIIKAEGSTYWKQIEQIITNETTATRDAAWQAALDIRNTWISSNAVILADATTAYASLWAAIEPSMKSVHDGIIYSFQDSGSQVKMLMDQMGSDATISLMSFQTQWTTVWQQMLADLQNTASQISSILQQLGAKVGNISVNASVNVSGGGGGSYGGSADMSGSGGGGGGGGGGGSNGAIINTNGTANFQDTTCLGDLVLVNALKYTNPNGQISYINPLEYIGGGGISSYQGGGGGSNSYSSVGGGGGSSSLFSGYGNNPWAAEGAIVDKPSVVHVGERGPELILPANLTKMFLNLAGGEGMAARSIVIEDHTVHHWYMNGKEITNQIMKATTKQLRLKGAISTR